MAAHGGTIQVDMPLFSTSRWRFKATSAARGLLTAVVLVACGPFTRAEPAIPVCSSICVSPQVCMHVCHDGGAEDSECVIVKEEGAVYTAPDGGPVDVCDTF